MTPPTLEFIAYRPAVCTDRETTLQLLVRVHPPAPGRSVRPKLNLGLAIDRSGSMAGLPMDHARRAGAHLIEQMRPDDRMSVIAFDNIVDTLVPSRPIGESGRAIVASLDTLYARGGTDLHLGWLEACHQVEKGLEEGGLSRVLLLSDGQLNAGLCDSLRIVAKVEDWQRRGVSTSTVGLGLGYNEDLLAAMASAGNGNFYHVASPLDIAPIFGVELQGMANTSGRAVSLGFEGAPGVELLRVHNPLGATPLGRLKLADLVHGHPLDVLYEISVPARTQGGYLGHFRLAWTSVETGHRHQLTTAFELPAVPHGQLVEFPLQPEVLQKRAVQLAARSLRDAVAAMDKNDHARARAALEEGLETLREAGTSPELADYSHRLAGLLASLDRGAVNAVRKEARYSSSVMSLSSFSFSGGVRDFMALPPEQRTPERLREIMGLEDAS